MIAYYTNCISFMSITLNTAKYNTPLMSYAGQHLSYLNAFFVIFIQVKRQPVVWKRKLVTIPSAIQELTIDIHEVSITTSRVINK